jgi:periplasmic nitrate reductase NapD
MAASRRAFIRGQWGAVVHTLRPAQAGTSEIASLIVAARPQHLDTIADAILALGNAEIHGRDPKGKLIVVLEEPDQEAIGAKMNAISALPNVLSAAMVFHASDNGSDTS